MNGKQLKNSILQWAIQGKLVPQDPNDEPASVLLDKIRKEKERLIKEKKIKRDKNASVIFRGEDNSYYEKFTATGEVKCIDEEIPFEIPKGWEWCRLVEVGKTETGTTPSKSHPEYFGDYIPFLGPANILNSQIVSVTQGLSDIGVDYGRIVPKNTILQVCIGGSIGKCAIRDKPVTFNQQINSITPYLCNVAFVHIVLQSEYFRQAIMDKATGTATPIINRGNWENLLFPLPPINEQDRIVANITELTHFLGIYSNKQEELNALNTNMYQRVKKAILQEAIQGKLVPQIAEEGTAQELLEQIKTEKQKLVKEGKLKKPALNDSIIFKGDDNKYWEKVNGDLICIDDEIPFDLPQTWCWCRLRSISSIKGGKRIPVGEKLTVQDTGHKYIRVADMKNHTVKDTDIHYISDSVYAQIKAYTISCNDLYITVAGTIGCVGEIPEAFNNANLTENADKIVICNTNKKYLMYCLLSNFVQSQIKNSTTKVGQPKLAIIRIENLLIPLPPLEEQQRIVNKVNELTSYCCPVNFRF